jgi:hypothetical protein
MTGGFWGWEYQVKLLFYEEMDAGLHIRRSAYIRVQASVGDNHTLLDERTPCHLLLYRVLIQSPSRKCQDLFIYYYFAKDLSEC